jgi:hypothetical protein
MSRFRFIEQTPSLDGTVTVVHILYGYVYDFYIKADRTALAGLAHAKRERAAWFEPEARKFAEMEARRRKIIK